MSPPGSEPRSQSPAGHRPPAPTPNLPKQIGRYEVQRELGRGMMGVVYLALDPALGRKVAVKTISDHLGIPEEQREFFDKRFLAEAKAAATLSHPAIIGVHDVGRDPDTGMLFIALEYLPGRTLGQRLAQGPLEWREALRLTLRVAEGLNHAHEQGIVHRDIKPANIMVLDSGEPKIMDFGIAKIPESQLTTAGEVFGTPLFMSPEQASGSPLDGRSDLFSLGSMLYHLLTGRHGFDANSLPAIITRVLHHEPVAPSAVNPALPEPVDYIVARLIAKAPGRRYPDGRTVAEDIQDVLDGRPPRHRAAWDAQPQGEAGTAPAAPGSLGGTMLGGRLETVPEPRPSSPAIAETIGLEPPRPAALRVARDLIAGSMRHPLLSAAALVLILGAGYLATARGSSDPDPKAADGASDGKTAGPSLIERVGDALMPETARLSFGFDYSVRAVEMTVWIDDEIVLEKTLYGRVARKILGKEYHEGSLQEVFDLKPGPHEVKVRVAWDDNVKTESARGTFREGATRRLEASLGGLRKNLSLEWK